ncbi:metallophosphoesterase [Rhizobium sp. MHM7A]|uniref:metallophosphoesterase n=1 Tax=Rhizobium sp. MHM7A TaxID=2583233 RepID=UPI0011072FC9|nr:metallophosphoesterase [Rhizobium sp. MHM7A]TLX17039.1 serine/threonine protein phosphatase [Rhizobium sp. MHM7A]
MHVIRNNKDVRRYAIGDVHGCLSHLERALEWCSKDAASDGVHAEVILLGDFVDKGPDTRDVVELLISGSPYSNLVLVPIKGNHDHLLHTIWHDPKYHLTGSWWENGGQQTLMSYGWNPLLDKVPGDLCDLVPREHVDFLEQLPVMYETDDLFFVHAGLNHERALDDQIEHDLLWIRGPFLMACHNFGKPVVHGHAPDTNNPFVSDYRISLDAGCYGTGKLAIACFEPGERIPRTAVVKRNSIEERPQAEYLRTVDI